MRRPRVMPGGIYEIAARVLPDSGRPLVERTETGDTTPVYRIQRGGFTHYPRMAEKPGVSLAPEVHVHRLLHERGVLVPEMILFEPFNDVLGRSVMVTTEVPGVALGRRHANVDVQAVLVAAGRDLAIVNEIGVEGFGWFRRDQPSGTPSPCTTARRFPIQCSPISWKGTPRSRCCRRTT